MGSPMHVEILGPYAPGPPLPLPFFLSPAECGFPPPPDDYVDRLLALTDAVATNPTAPYFVRAWGGSRVGAGIHPGDVLVVDCAREVESGDVVVAALGGELTVKRVRVKSWRGGRAEALWLVPENEAYPLVAVTAEMEFSVWGVVTAVVHTLTRD